MGIPKYGDGWLCLGMKSSGHIRLALWRMDGEADTVEIPLETNEVKIGYPLNSECKVEKSDKGIKVSLPEKYMAVVLEIQY